MFICEDYHAEQNMYHKPVFATEIMFCSNPKNPITVEGTRAMPTPLYVDESSSLPQLRAWQVHWDLHSEAGFHWWSAGKFNGHSSL